VNRARAPLEIGLGSRLRIDRRILQSRSHDEREHGGYCGSL
jgi:hypothetical protein